MLEGQQLQELTGRSFGGYRIDQVIGADRLGARAVGQESTTGRPVALRLLHPYFRNDAGFAARFDTFARTVGQLNHPNIARLLDAGIDGDQPYTILDADGGESLRSWLGRQPGLDDPVRVGTVLGIVAQLGSALGYAHRLGAIHAGLSPDNVTVAADGRAHVRDFGLVLAIGEAAGVLPTPPEYSTPEALAGLTLGPTTDEYALALLTYELLTGAPPFQAETRADVVRLQREEPPPSPRTRLPSLPLAAEAALLRALAKDPAARHGSVDGFLASLLTAFAPPEQAAPAVMPVPVSPLPIAAQPGVTSAPADGVSPAPASADTAAAPDGAATGPPADPASRPTGSRPTPPRSPRRSGGAGRLVAIAATLVVIVLTVGGGYMILNAGRPARPEPTPAAGQPTAPVAERTAPPAPTSPPTLVASAPTQAAAPAPSPTPSTASVASPAATTSTSGGAPASPTPQAGPGTPPAKPAPTPAAGGQGSGDTRLAILYSSHRADVHDSQIFIMNPDGTDQRPLTATRGHSWAPRASPDGKRLLFSSVAPGAHTSHEATGGGTSTSPGNHDIYLADVDGSNIVNLTSRFNSWDNGWSWSPDGKWIAFASDRDGNWEIYKMTPDGESIIRLTTNPAADGWPSWTPDAKKIVFASNRVGNWEIFAMDQDGGNAQRLTTRPETYDTYPFVSPDGRRIVFSSQFEGRNEGEIYVMGIDGSQVTRLTSTIALNNLPSWCPDGDKIVFVSDRDGDENVWIMNADGSSPKQLTTAKGEDTTPNCAAIRRTAP